MCVCQELLTCITYYQAVFNNKGPSSILFEVVAYLGESNVAKCRDGEVHIQCDLKLAKVDLGC